MYVCMNKNVYKVLTHIYIYISAKWTVYKWNHAIFPYDYTA